jgi:uncharacterized membrane protein HdeD (DUF308 family)
MTEYLVTKPKSSAGNRWLKSYYFTRAAFSVVWVAAAFTLADSMSGIVGALLLIYPAWDAAANLVDARRNGGVIRNPTQLLNAAASGVTTVVVAIALAMSMNAVLGVFGVWAALSGLLQLATGIRRRKGSGAQWPMIISGAQSTFVGIMFLQQANSAEIPSIAAIAPYAAFGAFYFLVAALWLTVSDARRRRCGQRCRATEVGAAQPFARVVTEVRSPTSLGADRKPDVRSPSARVSESRNRSMIDYAESSAAS